MKYDALLLCRHGIRVKNIYFDTMLAAYDCFGDWEFFNLGFLVERLLGKRIRRYNCCGLSSLAGRVSFLVSGSWGERDEMEKLREGAREHGRSWWPPVW